MIWRFYIKTGASIEVKTWFDLSWGGAGLWIYSCLVGGMWIISRGKYCGKKGNKYFIRVKY